MTDSPTPPDWDTLESELPPPPPGAGINSSPRDALIPVKAPKVMSADRTPSGLRRCSIILEGRQGRCEQPVVIPTDFCRSHGGFAARARIIARRDYSKIMKGSEPLRALFAQFYADEDLTDIRAELSLQRTMLAAFLEKLGASTDGEVGTETLGNPDVIAAITALNREVARLAEQAAQAELRVPTSVSMAQISWVVRQIVDAVESALIRELECGQVEVGDPSYQFDGDGATTDTDGRHWRPVDLVRRRVLARVADSMEGLVIPNRGVEDRSRKVFHDADA